MRPSVDVAAPTVSTPAPFQPPGPGAARRRRLVAPIAGGAAASVAGRGGLYAPGPPGFPSLSGGAWEHHAVQLRRTRRLMADGDRPLHQRCPDYISCGMPAVDRWRRRLGGLLLCVCACARACVRASIDGGHAARPPSPAAPGRPERFHAECDGPGPARRTERAPFAQSNLSVLARKIERNEPESVCESDSERLSAVTCQ
jgi:hypothetical protein